MKLPVLLVALFGCLVWSSAEAAPAPDHADASIRPDLCPGEFFVENPIRILDFMGFFPTLDGAVAVASQIDPHAFEITVRDAADGYGLVVVARYMKLPDTSEFEAHIASMRALGKRHGGTGFTTGCGSHYYRRRLPAAER